MHQRELTKLSDTERDVVGDPGDWEEIEGPTETYAPRRQTSAQFSLRIERDQIQAIRRIADKRQTTFSDVVRDAIRHYVETTQVFDRAQISTTKAVRAAAAWPADESLSAAL